MRWLVLAVPLFFLVAGVGVLVFAVLEQRWFGALRRRALVVRALVVGDETRRRSGSVLPGSFIHFPIVRYAGPDGQAIQTRTRYGQATALPRLTEVEVRYDPMKPERCLLMSGEAAGPPLAMMYVLGGLFVVAGYLLQAVVRALLF